MTLLGRCPRCTLFSPLDEDGRLVAHDHMGHVIGPPPMYLPEYGIEPGPCPGKGSRPYETMEAE